MSDRKAVDQRPGPVPEIRAEGDSIVFHLSVPTEHGRIVIRCDPDGAVHASIDLDTQDS
jgi:hypothetical protein